jgi:hypothetical protein
VGRTCFIAILIGTLINGPILASSKPSGTITETQAALLDRSAAAVGATVYPGDTLETNFNGSMRLRAGLAQIYMPSSSQARIVDAAKGVHAALLHGTIGFSSGPSDIVEVNAIDIAIRSRDGQPAHGRVSIISPTELVVSSIKGGFDVSLDGDTQAISEGRSYRVTIVQDQPPPQGAGSGTIPTVRSGRRKLKVLLIAAASGGAAAGAVYLYRFLEESPDRPRRND